MLSYLAVKNVSVIESVSLEMNDGLTVLTGETGSGKSVLLSALKLLLGDRFQKNMLREGADKLMVEGIFNDVSKIPGELKEQFDISDELIIRREVDSAGKGRVFINGMVAGVTQLKEFAVYLADIHGQHEHQTLLDENKHIDLIDHLVPTDTKRKYADAYDKYRTKKNELDKLLAELDDVKKYQDIVLFQLNEINSVSINLAEDKELDDTIAILSHIEKIREACSVSLESLSDGEVNATVLTSKAAKALEGLTKIIPESASYVQGLNDALSLFNDISRYLTGLLEKNDISPEELDRLIQRRYSLTDIIKKYGGTEGTLESVLVKRDELQEKLNNFENSDDVLARLKKECETFHTEAQMEADILLKARMEVSGKISDQVISILAELELPNSKFMTQFVKKNNLDASGGYDAKFYISVNPGFEPAPLAQVASGGEISRVMLALKEVFGESDPVQTMLFDEIDTGISGKTAKQVAAKLKKLGKKKQIVVITHLPVVAAAGENHFYISKNTDGVSTKTTIVKLGREERQAAIARMIAGELTPSAMQHAAELLDSEI